MLSSSPVLKRIGLVLFSIGILLAFALTALMVWADVESNSYGFPRLGHSVMRGLNCPVFLNPSETSSFSVTLRNATEQPLRPRVQSFVSSPGLARWTTDTKQLQIEPGQSGTAAWDLDSEGVVLQYFVLVKAYTFASYPQPDVEGTCGIFVIDLFGLDGQALYWLWLATSMAFTVIGVWLSDFRRAGLEHSGGRSLARKVLAVLAVIGVIAGSAGWWPLGIIVLAVMVIGLPAVLFFGETR